MLGTKILGMSRNVKLKACDGIVVDSDDALEFCAEDRATIIFSESHNDIGGEHRKPWPLTYILPPINSLIKEKILKAKTKEDANALKSSSSFCSSFLDPIIKDVIRHLDDSM